MKSNEFEICMTVYIYLSVFLKNYMKSFVIKILTISQYLIDIMLKYLI